ncbi:MAG: class I SAM-dependent methyltransferase [Verrucomicrobia bacterium]|nr:class I SAM-dependent methyltransferase [Verrucomicrobiota bacterium]
MSFDRLAPIYHLIERIAAGDKMQRCRTAFLDQIPTPQNILTLGEGHGQFLHECLRRFPKSHITCVDASAGMIRQARSNLANHGLDDSRVHWIQADVLSWTTPQAVFDLIATHFFLDCFRADQLNDLIPSIAGAAAPNATWLLADFQVAAKGWQRVRTRAILAIMYAFFRLTTRLPARALTPPDPYLERAGFQRHDRIEIEWGLLKSDWWRKY